MAPRPSPVRNLCRTVLVLGRAGRVGGTGLGWGGVVVPSECGVEPSPTEIAAAVPALRLALGVAAMARHRPVALVGAVSASEREVLDAALDALWVVLDTGAGGWGAQIMRHMGGLQQIRERLTRPGDADVHTRTLGPLDAFVAAGWRCWKYVSSSDDKHAGFAASLVLADVERWSEQVLDDRRPGWAQAPDAQARKYAFREVSIEVGQQRLDLLEVLRVGPIDSGRFLREARWRAELVAAERVASFRADFGL